MLGSRGPERDRKVMLPRQRTDHNLKGLTRRKPLVDRHNLHHLGMLALKGLHKDCPESLVLNLNREVFTVAVAA